MGKKNEFEWPDDDAEVIERPENVPGGAKDLTESFGIPVEFAGLRWVKGEYGPQLQVLLLPLHKKIDGYKGSGYYNVWYPLSKGRWSQMGQFVESIERIFPDLENRFTEDVESLVGRRVVYAVGNLFRGDPPPKVGDDDYEERLIKEDAWLPVGPIEDYEGTLLPDFRDGGNGTSVTAHPKEDADLTRFKAWIKKGLQDGSLKMNSVIARGARLSNPLSKEKSKAIVNEIEQNLLDY